jgi:hypothetical protein
MTQARIPGPLGGTTNGDTIEAPPAGLALRPGRRTPQGDRPPGPIGLHIWSAPIFAAPGAVAKVTNTGSGSKALIVVGTGHDDLKKGVRHTDDKHFNEEILAFRSALRDLPLRLCM